jgi:hypothetical protein
MQMVVVITHVAIWMVYSHVLATVDTVCKTIGEHVSILTNAYLITVVAVTFATTQTARTVVYAEMDISYMQTENHA